MPSNKKFNTTGICIPSLHYMADTTDMIDQIIQEYIEPGEYFTINRARQYGKTTTLELLYHKLKEKYIVIDISFEAADEYFQSLGTLARGLTMDIADRLEAQGVRILYAKHGKFRFQRNFLCVTLGKK